MKSKIKQRIVAEITRNWSTETCEQDALKPILSQQFETVIEVNRIRGFKLESWAMTSLLAETNMNRGRAICETIIAVFVQV